MKKTTSKFEFTPGTVLRSYSTEETRMLLEQWLAVFGRDRQGVNSNAYLWHIFSGERYPCVEGVSAEQEYARQQAAQFVLLSNNRSVAVLTDTKPDWCSHPDAYVFPPNMAWVMAFTHEAGWLGPYYACHPEYERLNRENLAAIKKRHEIELAKRKGWA